MFEARTTQLHQGPEHRGKTKDGRAGGDVEEGYQGRVRIEDIGRRVASSNVLILATVKC